MAGRRSRSADPFEDAIETALRPGQFIGSGYDEDSVSDLAAVIRGQREPGLDRARERWGR